MSTAKIKLYIENDPADDWQVPDPLRTPQDITLFLYSHFDNYAGASWLQVEFIDRFPLIL